MRTLAIVLTALQLCFMSHSTADAQWTRIPGPGNPTRFASGGGVLFAADRDSGVYRTTDQGETWTAVNAGLPSLRVIGLGYSGHTLFAGTPTNGGYQSIDSGASWTPINPGIHDTGVVSFASCLTDSGVRYLYAGTYSHGIFRSSDEGNSWSTLGGGGCAFALGAIESFVFVGTYDFAFYSGDRGDGWQLTTLGATADWALARGGSGGIIAYAAVSTGIYPGGGVNVSYDSGKTWDKVSGDIPSNDVLSLAISGEEVFAGTGGDGIYRSSGDVLHWTDVGSGLPSMAVLTLAPHGDYLFAGLYDGGVWRRPLLELLASDEGPQPGIPGLYRLDQNYPNPFNPITTIRFSLPGTAHASIRVYTLGGEEVATLVNGTIAPGWHDVQFDAAGLPTGVYFYRLRAGEFLGTKKLTVLR